MCKKTLEDRLRHKIDFWSEECYEVFRQKADILVTFGLAEDTTVNLLTDLYRVVDKEGDDE